MTQAGYYDYEPTVQLGRPVIITGQPGCAFREVAYDLAALTGLPLHDLDRHLEHVAGQSLWALGRQRGLEVLHTMEGHRLKTMLASCPPGIIIAGEGALLDPDRLAAARTAAGLVFLQLSAASCYWALRRRAEERDGILGHPWLPDRLTDPEDLRPLLGLLRPVAAAADHLIDMEQRGVREAVLDVQASLPGLGAPAAAADICGKGSP